MKEVQIEKPKVKIVESKESHTWTQGIIATLGNNRIFCSELKTGCGILQLHNITNFTSEQYDNFEEILHSIINHMDRQSGTFICTLGSMYYKNATYYHLEEFLLKYGFNVVKEYLNVKHYHMGQRTDFQKLYIYTKPE